MNNATKSTWYPVHLPDAGNTTDNVILADDPIHGELVGCYRSMGSAHYHARLHNNHVSGHPGLREVDLMFQSEIHYGIVGFWDGGVEWYLGVDLEHADARGNQPTIEEALADLVNTARKVYPESTFASCYKGVTTVQQDQRSLDDIAATLADKHGSFSLSFDATENYVKPDDCPWTLKLDSGHAWVAFTARAALTYAEQALNA